METGIVKYFNNEKKFGFIKRDNSEKDLFFHISSVLSEEDKDLQVNDKVEYEFGQNDRGDIATSIKKI